MCLSPLSVGVSVVSVPASGQVTVRQGEPVSLLCNTTGNPPPVITWTRPVLTVITEKCHFSPRENAIFVKLTCQVRA